jgi:hypothetical protein
MKMEIEYRQPRTPLVPPGGIECFARDMTATVSADLTLAFVQNKLAELGQWLPIDGDPASSIGGLVETNSTGPLRLGYGAWRDLLLGAQFLNGRGELITAGGRAVKNVAGYDLTKFMVGQRGLFGRLVTLTTRTYRRPAAALLAALGPDPLLATKLLTTPLRPQWALLTPEALLLGYLGDQRTIGFYVEQLPAHQPTRIAQRSLDEDIAHRAEALGASRYRAALPPTRILEFVRMTGVRDWCADPVFGIVRVRDEISLDEVQKGARTVGGLAHPDQGELPLAQIYDAAQLKVIERLKYAFDSDKAFRTLAERGGGDRDR